MKLLEKDKRVCVEIEDYKPDLSEYNFVVLRGELEVVRDPEERGKVIKKNSGRGKTETFNQFSRCSRLQKGRRLVFSYSRKGLSDS